MKWSALCDLSASESSRRAAAYLRALWRMGYVDLVPAAEGPPLVQMTARGLKILAHVTSQGEESGVCEVCGARVDSFHRDRLERTLSAFEKDYGIELSITYCCTSCLTLPEHLLRRLAAFLRRWYSSGRPRAVLAESWVVEDMEITGFLDSRYRPAQFYLDVQPRKGARPMVAEAEGLVESEETAEVPEEAEPEGAPLVEVAAAAPNGAGAEQEPLAAAADGTGTGQEPFAVAAAANGAESVQESLAAAANGAGTGQESFAVAAAVNGAESERESLAAAANGTGSGQEPFAVAAAVNGGESEQESLALVAGNGAPSPVPATSSSAFRKD